MYLDREKLEETLLYIANKKPGMGFIQVFKIIFFAEEKHLARHGRMIVGDKYKAMPRGPVPSHLYNVLRTLRGENNWVNVDTFSKRIEVVDHHFIYPKDIPNTDFLSMTDLECLDESFEENKDYGPWELSEKSHGTAWQSAELNQTIDPIEMAIEAGASQEMVDYLRDKNGFENSLSHLSSE